MATDKELVMRYCTEALYPGELSEPQGIGETVEPECGDVMRIYIKTHREIITEISYTITESACYPVKACAEVAARLAKDKPVMEAYLIKADSIGNELGKLDEAHIHCAIMAELTLKSAIVDYVTKRNMAMKV